LFIVLYNTAMFVDEAEIIVESGKGGDGIVHFRREKYINRGGPDGGDGGHGGDIIFQVNRHLNTLENFRHQRVFRAEHGGRGGVKNQTGKSGKDLVIDVPSGTVITNVSTGDLMADLVEEGQKIMVCPGGRGGHGNTKFANSRKQAPRLAEKGEPGKEMALALELKLIADVGIIGMPNAGKSSFLAAVTNAKPKIANYPFTTLIPNLGVARLDLEVDMVLADIPGLIEGAHTGLGLGDTFLRHIQRTKVLIHVLDGLSTDPLADYSQINTELSLFDPELGNKPQVVLLNKMDVQEVKERKKTFQKSFHQKGIEIDFVSAFSRTGLKEALWKAYHLLQEVPEIIEVEDIPVYRPTSNQTPFEIIKKDTEWLIQGEAIERAAEMTYWDYFESVRRFHRIMNSMGVSDALMKAGIQEGDTVLIRDHEFVWTNSWE